MALNYKKSGHDLQDDIPEGETVGSGKPWIFGKQLGVTLSGGTGPKKIAVAMAGVFTLPCEGVSFPAGTRLHFSIPNLAVYAGDPVPADFENVGLAGSPGGGAIEECAVKLNAHTGTWNE